MTAVQPLQHVRLKLRALTCCVDAGSLTGELADQENNARASLVGWRGQGTTISRYMRLNLPFHILFRDVNIFMRAQTLSTSTFFASHRQVRVLEQGGQGIHRVTRAKDYSPADCPANSIHPLHLPSNVYTARYCCLNNNNNNNIRTNKQLAHSPQLQILHHLTD